VRGLWVARFLSCGFGVAHRWALISMRLDTVELSGGVSRIIRFGKLGPRPCRQLLDERVLRRRRRCRLHEIRFLRLLVHSSCQSRSLLLSQQPSHNHTIYAREQAFSIATRQPVFPSQVFRN
jgi:hypothetical protein